MLLTVVINGHNNCVTQRKLDLCGMLRPSTYGDAVCVNAAVEINVLHYNVAVCSVNVVLADQCAQTD